MGSLDIFGISPEQMDAALEAKKKRGRRDARVCICGHAGGAHFLRAGAQTEDIDTYPKGVVGCQAGKTPCACDEFTWVLTVNDVRSFIQKTEGPGPAHALVKGVASADRRGLTIEWREGLACFLCKGAPSEVGPLTVIAYNERGGEAMRSTNENRFHCEECRAKVRDYATANAGS